MDDVESFTTPDGAKLSYLVRGGSVHGGWKPPLLLIMGLSGVLEDWQPLDVELAKSRPVIVYDHRGIGKSTAPSDELTIEMMANDALLLLQHLKIQHVDILGFSMGGLILQNILIRLQAIPVTVHHAILAATMPRFLRRKESALLRTMGTDYSNIPQNERKRKMTEDTMRIQYDEDWFRSPEHQKLFEHRVNVSLNTRRPAKVVMLQSASIGGINYLDSLANIPPSTKILWFSGVKDTVVSRSVSILIPKAIKHAQVLDNVRGLGNEFGHFFFDYGRIQYWAKAFNDFLDDTPKSKL